MNENTPVTCAEARELFSVHEDGTLAVEAGRAVDAHLLACEGCREAFADHRRAMAALRGTVPIRTSQDEVNRILLAVDEAAGVSAPVQLPVQLPVPSQAPPPLPRVDAPGDEVLVYRRALLATARLVPASRARRVAVLAVASLMGAAAAVLLGWSLGWASPFGGRPDAAITGPEVVTGAGVVPRAEGPLVSEVQPSTADRLIVRIDTEPLARLGQRVWGDVRQDASQVLSVLRAQAQRMQATPVELPDVAVRAPTETVAEIVPPLAFVEPAGAPSPLPKPQVLPQVLPPPPTEIRLEGGMAVVVRTGPGLELRVSGSVREMVPTLLNLLDREDEDLVALASARLEDLRGKVAALPQVGPAVEQQLAAAGDSGSWWTQLFRKEPAPEPEPTLSESWMHWWSVAEPLLPADPGEGAA